VTGSRVSKKRSWCCHARGKKCTPSHTKGWEQREPTPRTMSTSGLISESQLGLAVKCQQRTEELREWHAKEPDCA
jgi:hypothetical protein